MFAQEQEIELSIGGLFENVYDKNGKPYSLGELMVQSSVGIQNECTAGYFHLTFEVGSGFNTADDWNLALIAQRQATACAVFGHLSAWINSPLNNPGNTQLVEIQFPSIEDLLGVWSDDNLGRGAPLFAFPPTGGGPLWAS